MRLASAFALTAGLAPISGHAGAVPETPGYDTPRIVAKITQGEPSTADPAVVALATYDPCHDAREVYCTGTLIAPRVVLTAAHCVAQPVELVEVFFGDDVEGQGQWLRAAALRADPSFEPTTYAHDLGAVILGADAPVEPVAYGASVSDASLGADARIVGFGIPEPGGGEVGLKRTGQTLVSSVAAQSFETVPNPAMSCQIDSGGPVLLRDDQQLEVVAGVTSNGDAFCEEYAVNTRVDAHLDDFLSAVLDEAASAELPLPSPPSAESCPGCSVLGCSEGEVCDLDTDTCVIDEPEAERGCSAAPRGHHGIAALLLLLLLRRFKAGSRATARRSRRPAAA